MALIWSQSFTCPPLSRLLFSLPKDRAPDHQTNAFFSDAPQKVEGSLYGESVNPRVHSSGRGRPTLLCYKYIISTPKVEDSYYHKDGRLSQWKIDTATNKLPATLSATSEYSPLNISSQNLVTFMSTYFTH